jgi:hypothetical protein
VADCGNGRVQVVGLDGSFVRKFDLEAGGVRPARAQCHAVAVDGRTGNVVVVAGKDLRLYSASGNLFPDKLGGLEVHCATIGGVAIDQHTGHIACCDSIAGSTRVTILSPIEENQAG